jgi:hypothetical protein
VLPLREHWVDATRRPLPQSADAPDRHDIFARAKTSRYVVIWDLHWRVIEVQRLEPASDLYGALVATVERLKRDGWEIEGAIDHGFAFANRDGERRLLALTERDPADTERQAFTPWS